MPTSFFKSLLLTALVAASAAPSIAAELIVVQDPVSGDPITVRGMSGDGRIIVGNSDGRPIRWSLDEGVVDLGNLTGDLGGTPWAASRDGSVIVGEANRGLLATEAFMWTAAGGMVGLGDFAGGGLRSYANGISADGSVIVGAGTSDTGAETVRWSSGVIEGLGLLPGASSSFARAVSADGSVIVGQSGVGGFRWTEADDMQPLGALPGGTSSPAFGVSGDGSAIVGFGSNAAGDQEAFRWTADTGPVGLGDFDGGAFRSWALDANFAGNIVVGFGTAGVGNPEISQTESAFIWDEQNGMRELRTVLEALGVDLTGWVLHRAEAISDNGIWVAGNGTYEGTSTAFLARLPEPGSGVLAAIGLTLLSTYHRRERSLASSGTHGP